MTGTTTVRIGAFTPGVDNVRERTQLETLTPTRQRLQAFAGAENIDVNDGGSIRRRRGYQIRTSGADAHSLWGDGGDDGYAVIGGDLIRLLSSGDGLAFSLVRPAMGPQPVSYDRHPDGRVFYSSIERNGVITRGADGRMAPPAIASEPIYSLEAGALPAGRYLVAITRIEDGIEGPPGQIVQLELGANAALRLVGLPGTPVRIYLSAPNGHEPLLQLTTTATAETLAVVALDGIRCQTLRLAELPPGQILRHHAGRVLVAAGPYLLWSEPYSPLYAAGESYIEFPSVISIVRPVKGGVYVVADQTYWLTADMKTDLRPLLPYGALPGTDGRRPTEESVFWLSDRGLVVGTQDGQVKNVQEDRLSLAGGTRGATLLRERNGCTHVITTRTGAQPLINPADGYLAAELQRPKDFP